MARKMNEYTFEVGLSGSAGNYNKMRIIVEATTARVAWKNVVVSKFFVPEAVHDIELMSVEDGRNNGKDTLDVEDVIGLPNIK